MNDEQRQIRNLRNTHLHFSREEKTARYANNQHKQKLQEHKNKIKNKNKNKMITYHNKTLTHKAWAQEFNLKLTTFKKRLKLGWSMKRIQHTPTRQKGINITHWKQSIPIKTNSPHQVIRMIYTEMQKQQCTYEMLAKRSGVNY